MGMIIKGGVEYNFGSSSNTDSSSMEIVTREEYDTLVANGTVKTGVYYFITDESVEEKSGITSWVIDETTGKITGYTTEIGGADTVFPFNNSVYKNVVYGDFTPAADTSEKISIGFKPEIIFVFADGNHYESVFYDENISTTSFKVIRLGQTTYTHGTVNIASNVVGIRQIVEDGFYYFKGNSTGTMHYICLGN